MHLKQCILDFGPINCFWFFSFERYNGMLGNQPNKKRNIELQIMSRFCTENIALNLEKPVQFQEHFSDTFLKLDVIGLPRGTLQEMKLKQCVTTRKLSSRYVKYFI